jgi:hypothetical protein
MSYSNSTQCTPEAWICMKGKFQQPLGLLAKSNVSYELVASIDRPHEPTRLVPITASFAGDGTQVLGKGLHGRSTLYCHNRSSDWSIVHSIPNPSDAEEAHIVFICDHQAHTV